MDLVRFTHKVGASTLKEGLAIPVSAQNGKLSAIQKGASKKIQIVFDNGLRFDAEIKRLANARGHLQIRYNRTRSEKFRTFLQKHYDQAHENLLIEVAEETPSVFLVNILGSRLWISQRFSANIASDYSLVTEIDSLGQGISRIHVKPTWRQADYNENIRSVLQSSGWKSEVPVHEDLGIRCDFRKDNIWMEVEFGNARTYYQDLMKFLLSQHYKNASLGILLCPTKNLADIICGEGRRRAESRLGREASYSGMMTYEKAESEWSAIKRVISPKMIVAGIEYIR
jgi:hypothetical protein